MEIMDNLDKVLDDEPKRKELTNKISKLIDESGLDSMNVAQAIYTEVLARLIFSGHSKNSIKSFFLSMLDSGFEYISKLE